MSGLHRSISSTPTAGSVNVDQAKTEFHELSRQLTQGTVTGDNERGIQSAPTCASVDLEKGHDTSDSEQPFDLREYLTSSNDANEAAGIKHKHVGVIWEDLHVDVIGGSNFKVGQNTTLSGLERLLTYRILPIASRENRWRSVPFSPL
jgi:ATP-binding cassette, subfamily G (WHITE), member 2, SNQ2